MSRAAAHVQSMNLAMHAGHALLSAPQAILKGVLEADYEVSLMIAVQGSFELDETLTFDPGVQEVLKQHNMRVQSVATASRAVSLAASAARSGKGALALIPNEQLDSVVGLLAQIGSETLERGAMVILIEDRPRDFPASCPRSAVHRLNMACIEPADVAQLRDAMEEALRVSRASRRAAAIVVHHSILHSADTLEVRPNRVHSSVDAMLARRKRPRGLRWTDATGPLRAARRLELNRMRAMPSPGERVPIGFITVGPCDTALQHVTNALGLHGRVPVLQLGLINPVDESAVDRLLTRCQRIIVLEPRAGVLETQVLAIAERMRHAGEQPATVWGEIVPEPESDPKRVAERIPRGHTSIDRMFTLHPSLLVRRVVHLLHMVRPTAQIETRLAPDPPFTINPTIPARGTAVGQRGALGAVKRILADVDQWLREQTPSEESGLTHVTGLAIDGAPAAAANLRVVTVETWDHHRYVQDGLPALGLAAAENRPWMFVVCESESEPLGDLERLTRGAIPADVADRVRLYTGNLNDQTALRDMMREAALDDRMSVMVVRDGPPARFDVAAIQRALEDVDRLGFEPRQRLIRSAEAVCAITPGSMALMGIDLVDEEVEASEWSVADDQASWSAAQMPELKSHMTVEEVSRSSEGSGAGFRVRVRPLLEEVEVIRTRPPLMSWRRDAAARLPAPQPIHARSTAWRAHLAGIRREPPGVAAQVLCEAGRLMGYHVRYVHDPTPIGAGLGAWAQVLFTHPSQAPQTASPSAMIPHGEADVLIGLDEHESWRAIGGDPMLRVAHAERTHAVVNLKPELVRAIVADEGEAEPRDTSMSSLALALGNVTAAQPRLMDDFGGACKAWFHTDRVADLAMLGAAYQLGLIPVSTEAIEAAVNLVQSRGYGRSREAFEFGRRLAMDHELFGRPREEAEENVERLSRRIVLSLSRGGWGGGGRARNMHELLHQSLGAMPGLAETEAGRTARRTFVQACHRCRVWGGFEYARQYAEVITRLYQHDRADTGRALTRNAVLPLADAMLIRDPLYLAGMATSSEQRRRLRQWLNVKLARGDHIERRYLTRIEFVGFSRLVRADIKTSDWPARVVSLFRRVVPVRWRGSRRQRELREYVVDFIKRAADRAVATDQRWLEPMHRLHLMALEDRLRDMAIAEVKMLVEAGASEPAEPSKPQSVKGAA